MLEDLREHRLYICKAAARLKTTSYKNVYTQEERLQFVLKYAASCLPSAQSNTQKGWR